MRRHARSALGMILVAGAMALANLFPSPARAADAVTLPFLWVAPLVALVGLWLLGAVKEERLGLSALPALCLTALFLALYGAGGALGFTGREGLLSDLLYSAAGMPCAFLMAYGLLSVSWHIAAVARKKERPAFSAKWAVFYLGLVLAAVALDFAMLRLRDSTLGTALGELSLAQFTVNILAFTLAAPIAVPYILSLSSLRFGGVRRWVWPALCAVGCAFFWFSLASPSPYLGRTWQAIVLPLWLILAGVTRVFVSRWRAKEARWASRKRPPVEP